MAGQLTTTRGPVGKGKRLQRVFAFHAGPSASAIRPVHGSSRLCAHSLIALLNAIVCLVAFLRVPGGPCVHFVFVNILGELLHNSGCCCI